MRHRSGCWANESEANIGDAIIVVKLAPRTRFSSDNSCQVWWNDEQEQNGIGSIVRRKTSSCRVELERRGDDLIKRAISIEKTIDFHDRIDVVVHSTRQFDASFRWKKCFYMYENSTYRCKERKKQKNNTTSNQGCSRGELDESESHTELKAFDHPKQNNRVSRVSLFRWMFDSPIVRLSPQRHCVVKFKSSDVHQVQDNTETAGETSRIRQLR